MKNITSFPRLPRSQEFQLCTLAKYLDSKWACSDRDLIETTYVNIYLQMWPVKYQHNRLNDFPIPGFNIIPAFFRPVREEFAIVTKNALSVRQGLTRDLLTTARNRITARHKLYAFLKSAISQRKYVSLYDL